MSETEEELQHLRDQTIGILRDLLERMEQQEGVEEQWLQEEARRQMQRCRAYHHELLRSRKQRCNEKTP